jgi:hypothetical protein
LDELVAFGSEALAHGGSVRSGLRASEEVTETAHESGVAGLHGLGAFKAEPNALVDTFG